MKALGPRWRTLAMLAVLLLAGSMATQMTEIDQRRPRRGSCRPRLQHGRLVSLLQRALVYPISSSTDSKRDSMSPSVPITRAR